MHNSSLICSDRKHGSEMRTPSTAPRSSFPVRGEGAELARRKGVMGSGGGMRSIGSAGEWAWSFD